MTAAMLKTYLRRFLEENYQGRRSQFQFESWLITIDKVPEPAQKKQGDE